MERMYLFSAMGSYLRIARLRVTLLASFSFLLALAQGSGIEYA